MIRTILLGVFAFAVAFAIYLYFYLGFTKPVEIAEAKRGPLHLLYKSHTGPYHKIGPAITAVEDWAREHKVSCEKTFGEFLDDPQAMDEDRLRSRAGCILSEPVAEFPKDFNYEQRPERTYVTARFHGSPAIGPMKVYPRVVDYFAEKRLKKSGAVIETYLINGQDVETEYLFPLD